MTKTQIKAQISKIRDLILELKDEVEITIDDIEPYDGKDDLTPQQEERQEWLEEVMNELENASDSLYPYDLDC